jgi:regulation of enolase protein 1 (concanavalin A-like superfamily)
MNSANRRQFLAQAAGLGCAALGTPSTLVSTLAAADGFSAPAIQISATALLGKMKWFNEPASAKESGEKFAVTTKPKTDFWRKTFYDYVTDNGHFFFLPVSGDFTFESRVAGKYAALYDQAGLMVRIDPGNWLKCGLELVDGIGHASVVVTRDFSDWSTVRGITTKVPLWWRIVRKGSSFEVLYSLDGKNFTSTRLGYLPSRATVDAGIMCCSPEGTGFECVFDEIRLMQQVRGEALDS